MTDRKHAGYRRGAALAASLTKIDACQHADGQLVPSTNLPFDNLPAFIAKGDGAQGWDIDGTGMSTSSLATDR